MNKAIVSFLFCIFVGICFAANSQEYTKDLTELVNSEMKQWSHKDIVINAVKLQNSKSADLSVSDLKILDSKWIGEKRKNKKPLIRKVLDNDLSEYLRKIQEDGEGLYTEIIVTDNRGLDVGQSQISSNYWQGQEDKWKNTFGSRSYATYVSDLHFDDNTEAFQVEVSFMIISDDEPIGMVYAGVDVEQLEEWKKRREE